MHVEHVLEILTAELKREVTLSEYCLQPERAVPCVLVFESFLWSGMASRGFGMLLPFDPLDRPYEGLGHRGR